MKQKTALWQLMGFAVTAFGGTILHFLYEWSGEVIWIAPISGINESTWEHMKLLFWPMLIFAFVQSFFFKDRTDFWCVKLRGILLGITLIPIIYYTYNGTIGKSPDWINIAIFFICAAIVFIYESRRFNSDIMFCRSPKKALIALLFIAALFVIFTFLSPKLGIFKDPVTGAYGL